LKFYLLFEDPGGLGILKAFSSDIVLEEDINAHFKFDISRLFKPLNATDFSQK